MAIRHGSTRPGWDINHRPLREATKQLAAQMIISLTAGPTSTDGLRPTTTSKRS